jgi:MFS family permease
LRSFDRHYIRLLAAAFLWGWSTTQLAMLAPVLARHAMSPVAIAAALSAPTVAVVPASLLSGALIGRYGAVRTMMLGGLISVIALMALPFTTSSVELVALAMGGRGIGAAFFFAAGQLFAQAQAPAADRTRAVGMFMAMLLIPSFFGPALGEWMLGYWGENGFFVLSIFPVVAALALLCRLPRADTPALPNTSGYLALLRDRRLWLPNLAVMQSGLAYAFTFTFLPLLLVQDGIKVALFFTPFAAALLVVRFAGLKYLQRLSSPALVTFGLCAYATGLYSLIALGMSVAFAPLCGLLFAFGYGVVLPGCVTWATSFYAQTERGRPVALVNACFHIGSITAMQITGAGLNLIGWSGVLIILATIVVAVMLAPVAAHALARVKPVGVS